jgi:TonB family protein
MRAIAAVVLGGLFSIPAFAQGAADRVLTSALLPQYPSTPRAAHITGDVRVSFRVDRAGNIKDVEVLSGPLMLRKATEEYVRSWKFEPSNSADEAGKLETQFRYRITLGCAETDIDKDTTIVTVRTIHNVEIATTAICTDDLEPPKPAVKTKKGTEQ